MRSSWAGGGGGELPEGERSTPDSSSRHGRGGGGSSGRFRESTLYASVSEGRYGGGHSPESGERELRAEEDTSLSFTAPASELSVSGCEYEICNVGHCVWMYGDTGLTGGTGFTGGTGRGLFCMVGLCVGAGHCSASSAG